MSAYYRRPHPRRAKHRSNGLSVLALLLGVTAYNHHISINQIITYGAVVWVGFIGIRLIYKRFRKRSRYSNVSMMSGLEFERYVANLLWQKGFTNIRLTEKYDLGVDIIAHKDGIVWGVQVKRCNGLVKAHAVRQVVTALPFYGCDRAMVITSRPAIILAESNNCVLLDHVAI